MSSSTQGHSERHHHNRRGSESTTQQSHQTSSLSSTNNAVASQSDSRRHRERTHRHNTSTSNNSHSQQHQKSPTQNAHVATTVTTTTPAAVSTTTTTASGESSSLLATSRLSANILEATKQQLELRKQYLDRLSVKNERMFLTGDDPQKKINFTHTVANFTEKRLANLSSSQSAIIAQSEAYHGNLQFQSPTSTANYSPKQHENTPSAAETAAIPGLNDQLKDPYYIACSLSFDQLIPAITTGESSPNVSDDDFSQSSSKNSSNNSNANASGNTNSSRQPTAQQSSHPRMKIPNSTRLETVISYLIDSNLLTIDRDPLPTPRERSTSSKSEGTPASFIGCRELLFYNINVELSYSDLKREIRDRFKQIGESPRYRCLYYTGKYSILVRFDSDQVAYQTYLQYKRNAPYYRSILGECLEVFKVSQNRIDKVSQDWVPLVLRNLPLHFDKNKVVKLLTGIVHKSEEEPILLNEKKHTLVFFNDIESAVQAMQPLTHRMREAPCFRVNFHPNFTKTKWKSLEISVNPYAGFYIRNANEGEMKMDIEDSLDDNSGDVKNSRKSQSQHTSKLLKFNRMFMEDIIQMKNRVAAKKQEKVSSTHSSDENKKFSQRSTTPVERDDNHQDRLERANMDTPSSSFNPLAKIPADEGDEMEIEDSSTTLEKQGNLKSDNKKEEEDTHQHAGSSSKKRERGTRTRRTPSAAHSPQKQDEKKEANATTEMELELSEKRHLRQADQSNVEKRPQTPSAIDDEEEDNNNNVIIPAPPTQRKTPQRQSHETHDSTWNEKGEERCQKSTDKKRRLDDEEMRRLYNRKREVEQNNIAEQNSKPVQRSSNSKRRSSSSHREKQVIENITNSSYSNQKKSSSSQQSSQSKYERYQTEGSLRRHHATEPERSEDQRRRSRSNNSRSRRRINYSPRSRSPNYKNELDERNGRDRERSSRNQRKSRSSSRGAVVTVGPNQQSNKYESNQTRHTRESNSSSPAGGRQRSSQKHNSKWNSNSSAEKAQKPVVDHSSSSLSVVPQQQEQHEKSLVRNSPAVVRTRQNVKKSSYSEEGEFNEGSNIQSASKAASANNTEQSMANSSAATTTTGGQGNERITSMKDQQQADGSSSPDPLNEGLRDSKGRQQSQKHKNFKAPHNSNSQNRYSSNNGSYNGDGNNNRRTYYNNGSNNNANQNNNYSKNYDDSHSPVNRRRRSSSNSPRRQRHSNNNNNNSNSTNSNNNTRFSRGGNREELEYNKFKQQFSINSPGSGSPTQRSSPRQGNNNYNNTSEGGSNKLRSYNNNGSSNSNSNNNYNSSRERSSRSQQQQHQQQYYSSNDKSRRGNYSQQSSSSNNYNNNNSNNRGNNNYSRNSRSRSPQYSSSSNSKHSSRQISSKQQQPQHNN